MYVCVGGGGGESVRHCVGGMGRGHVVSVRGCQCVGTSVVCGWVGVCV